MFSASVFSVYMSNIPDEVVAAQNTVVNKFLPPDWEFHQYLHSPKEFEVRHHAAAIARCIKEAKHDDIILLDIDCVPISSNAFHFLVWGAHSGTLIGAVQRAGHIQNEEHLYVGPFCMAFSKWQYELLASPSFDETDRGDCGEELTYRWEERRKKVRFLWPSAVEQPMWNLTGGKVFGYGTTYEDLFYHSFCSREQHTRERFLNKCDSILNSKEIVA
jgi:hypothetical protein